MLITKGFPQKMNSVNIAEAAFTYNQNNLFLVRGKLHA